MNIGIDIDDTINRLSDILPKYAKKYNKENKIEYRIKNDKWDFHEAFGWDEDNIERFLCKNIEVCFTKAKIKKNAKKYINKLKEEGNKIIIITSRSEEHNKCVYDVSKRWLLKHKIKFDKLYVGWENKIRPCIENDIDVFIDDHVEICKRVENESDIHVLLFDSVYNKEEKKLKRINNWKEAYEQIKNYENINKKNTTINV